MRWIPDCKSVCAEGRGEGLIHKPGELQPHVDAAGQDGAGRGAVCVPLPSLNVGLPGCAWLLLVWGWSRNLFRRCAHPVTIFAYKRAWWSAEWVTWNEYLIWLSFSFSWNSCEHIVISSDLFVIQKYLIHFYSFLSLTPLIRLPSRQALAQRVWALGCVSGGSTSPASGSGLLPPPWHTSRAGEGGTGLSVPVSGRPGTSVTG